MKTNILMSNSGAIQRTWIKSIMQQNNLVAFLSNVELLICDIDGSLTSGHLVCSDTQIESKIFSVVDGMGMTLWQNAGNKLAIISKRTSPATSKRMSGLGVPKEFCLLGVDDKYTEFKKILALSGFPLEKALMWGDDIQDFELKEQGVKIACPAQTPFYLQAQADLVLPFDGGTHSLRLLIDLLLFIQGKHPHQEIIRELCA